jgi:hypothetical protein
MTCRKTNGEFPILVKLFGSQEAGWKFLQNNGISSQNCAEMRSRGKLRKSALKVIFFEVARRGGFALTNEDFTLNK